MWRTEDGEYHIKGLVIVKVLGVIRRLRVAHILRIQFLCNWPCVDVVFPLSSLA